MKRCELTQLILKYLKLKYTINSTFKQMRKKWTCVEGTWMATCSKEKCDTKIPDV